MKTLGLLLDEIEKQVADNPKLGYNDRFASLRQEFSYLVQYMAQGYEDKDRVQLYDKMLKKSFMLKSDIKQAILIKNDSYLSGIRNSIAAMEVSSQSLVTLLKNQNVQPKQGLANLSFVFNAILVSEQWKEMDFRLWTSYLLDSSTPFYNSCTIVSAIMLSSYTNFSFEKLKTLVYVYLTSLDERIRQRALVGWMACVNLSVEAYKAEQLDLITMVVEDDDKAARDILGVLMLMTLCNREEAFSDKMEKEIMPNLAKGQTLQFSDMGISSGDEEQDSFCIDAEKSEHAMEEMEKSINKMIEMQKKGADLYYRGFSQMKRFPFFYNLSNWFTPFYKEHPDLREVMQKLDGMKFIETAFRDGPFCDSDKYSLAFALTHVVDSLPEKMRKMMDEGEVAAIGTMLDGEENEFKVQMIRQSYLQDLYRFFKLFPQRRFESIFGRRMRQISMILLELDENMYVDYGMFLLKNEEFEEVEEVLKNIDSIGDNIHFLQALYYQKTGDNEKAYQLFSTMLSKNASDLKIEIGFARTAYATCRYSEAAAAYDKLRTERENVLSYHLNYVVCEANSGRAEDIKNEAYRLDYEFPGNLSVKRVLGWTLLMAGYFTQARNLYDNLLTEFKDQTNSTDYLNAAYAEWLDGHVTTALTLMRQSLMLTVGKSAGELSYTDTKKLVELLESDSILLNKYGIKYIDMLMISDAVVGL